MTRLLPAVLVVAALSACTPEKPVSSASERPPTVIDPQLKALEDAKAVQATLDEAEKKRRKELDEAGG